MFHLPLKRTLATLVLLSLAGLSSASTLPQTWFLGNWTCNIDGRSGQMNWQIVNDPQISCQDGVCSSTPGVAYKGRFRDSQGAGGWVRLESTSSDGNDLSFSHTADFTPWFLRYDPNTRVATGNSMWRGESYSLQCSKYNG